MLCDSNSGIRAQVKIAEDKEITEDKEQRINGGVRPRKSKYQSAWFDVVSAKRSRARLLVKNEDVIPLQRGDQI